LSLGGSERAFQAPAWRRHVSLILAEEIREIRAGCRR
jgi:hypothetical protein